MLIIVITGLLVAVELDIVMYLIILSGIETISPWEDLSV